MTWEIPESDAVPGRSWKLKFNILESPGINLWLKLSKVHRAKFQ